jgi:hypothetical protein
MTIAISDKITINGKNIETVNTISKKPISSGTPKFFSIIEPLLYDKSLSLHYKFDENFFDSSGNNKHLLTHTGSPEISSTQFKFGKSSYFTNDALRTSEYTFNNKAFSISVWLYQQKNGVIISQGTTNTVNMILHCIFTTDYRYHFGFFGNDLFSQFSYAIDLNRWVHLVFQIDGNKNREIWRNGIKIANDISSSFLNTGNNEIIVGRWPAGNAGEELGGYMDDLRIYSRQLSPSEIMLIYTSYNNIQTLTIDEDYKYISFKNNGENQSQYTIQFLENTECDILVIGGGGAGGKRHGGGGGAGTLLYHKGQIFNGTYNIQVGRGGSPNTTNTFSANATIAENGFFSEFRNIENTKIYYANGGGYGSGGGRAATTNGGQSVTINNSITLPTNNIFDNSTVSVINKLYQNTLSATEGCRGFTGGFQGNNYKGGGGGGAGSIGLNHADESSIDHGYGGDGLGIDITGINLLYAGGGNGGDFEGTISQSRDPNKSTIESRGGGGFGSDNGNAENGKNGTGGGGGGQGNDGAFYAGFGGSGIVVIRYKYKKELVHENINDNYRYVAFTNNIKNIVYDFRPFGNLTQWKNYASTIPNSSFSFDTLTWQGIWTGNWGTGYFKLDLPNTHNYVEVTWGRNSANNVQLWINNILVSYVTDDNLKFYTHNYTGTTTLMVKEDGSVLKSGMIIRLFSVQKKHAIKFTEETECDILVVGGGGAGGRFGGGGGAGSVLYKSQITLNGILSVEVGIGGFGSPDRSLIGENGQQSKITINGVNYIADGGGGGGSRQESQGAGPQNGASGGSGGGGSHSNTGTVAIGGLTTKTSYIYTGWETNGFNGGDGRPNTSGTNPNHASGGGGGAGGAGQNWDSTGGGDGGLAKEYISVFGTKVGHNGYFGGGGGGNTHSGAGDVGFANGGNGLFGGGGNGGYSGSPDLEAGEGIAGTGGGGGGSKWAGGSNEEQDGGDGGSGVVIIRYKIIKENYNAQWTYSSTNTNVYHIGNVGIGTTNPITELEVNGTVNASIGISALSKTFKIEHPLNINKWLYHGCVEGSRYENMYRGKKLIINGRCEVDIDEECNDTGGMSKGTFSALNTNSQLYLKNNQTFDCVKGKINDGKIIINCQNNNEQIEVDWLVIGERKDKTVINIPITTTSGNLICEHNIN